MTQNQMTQNQMTQNQMQPVTKIAPMTQSIGNVNNTPYANLRESINPNILNQNVLNSNVNTQQMFNQNLNTNLEMENLRRGQINEQLKNMKEQIKKSSGYDSSDKPKYKSGPNVKRRGVDVDTSSSSGASDKSGKSDKSNNTSDTDGFDIKNSKTSNSENLKSKKVVVDKSLNSKNNASTFSKRKYKRNTITIDT